MPNSGNAVQTENHLVSRNLYHFPAISAHIQSFHSCSRLFILTFTMKLALILTLAVVVLVTMNVEQSEAQLGRVLVNIGRKIGGSGKPHQHFQQHNSRKAAENAARNAGKGNKPVQHAPHKPGQSPHYHPADRHGNIIKDGSHHQFPKRQG
ncbi:unnamed protein product [Allacma fusca]|uniref:Uncharacterized protein n=1 Tax=Allacma fusca TaxID=39272 RepID=A0A8J2LCT5_9HEXA|nr:unnamed protein product [Allacma fusca]